MRFLTLLIPFLMLLQGCSKETVVMQPNTPPPSIESRNHIDSYWEEEISDDFRHLENEGDTLINKWFRNYSLYSESILNKIPTRDSLIKLFKSFDKESPYRISKTKITNNDRYFYLKKFKGSQDYNLYYKEGYNGEETLLYDITAFSPKDSLKFRINYLQPSWDGSHVAIAISHSGIEISEILIINIKNRTVLPQRIKAAWPDSYLGISWLPDDSGFVFLHFPNAMTNQDLKIGTQSVLYKLGDDGDNLRPILSKKLNPSLKIAEKSYPIVTINDQNNPYLIAYEASVEPYWNAYYAPISSIQEDEIIWKPFYTKKDQISTSKGKFLKNDYFFITTKDDEQGTLNKVSGGDEYDFENSQILANTGNNEVIDDFKITSDGIYYTTLKNGVDASLYTLNETVSKKIKLPSTAGDINLSNRNTASPDLWVTISGWNFRSKRYHYDFRTDIFDFKPLSYYIDYPEFENFQIEEIEITSHDGTMVPLSLIYSKTLKKDGTAPVFLTGYGAYGDSYVPSFSTIFMSWVQQGGILAIAHVRGGGEKGDAWYKDGLKESKVNTWKDFIACAAYLVDKKYSSAGKITASGDSAGAIMAARAVIERPDVFSSLISQSGSLNPMRSEFSGGGSNINEYGTVKDSLEFKSLLKMDAYQQLQRKGSYPAVLLMTGYNDTRVKHWISGKFISKMNSLNITRKPALLKLKYDEGHSSNSIEQVYQDWAEIFSFALWQSGDADSQPHFSE